MTNNTNNFCVILAGGKGRRLWPCSRDKFPKQFIDFFGTGRTQLQQTYDHFAKILPPSNIFVVTNVAYASIVAHQLPQLGKGNLLTEPIHRNTAPSAAWATHRILRLNSSANIVITPSDQTVLNEEAFAANINDAFDFVTTHDCLLTMGVKPTRPEPGYGYIQMGDPMETDIYHVKSFTEKPERTFAQMFMDSGEFLWNTGLFIANARHAMESFYHVLPAVLRDFDKACPEFSIDAENAYIRENFPSYPNLSIDSGLLEKVDDVCVMSCDFGWADLGTWHSMYEAKSKGEGDNVIVDSNAIIDNAHNNVIKLPKERLAVISGLDGFIVAEKDNVLLICRKEDSSACVRKLINDVQIKKGEEFV